MPSATIVFPKVSGASFLLEDRKPAEIFTPEDFSGEHRAIKKTTEEFWLRDVVPNLESIQEQTFGVAVSVLRKSAELGLTAVLLPERFGGMEMDLTSAMMVAEVIARDGSYSAWHGAHAGIGTIPLLLFGTEEQKSKYLPRLASAEMIAAYCLSEPQAGSDALAARTRADETEDGEHYILNGQKMWITNGGAAHLLTVFAKINGEKFTAFLIERAWRGVSVGAEEKKMGIKGSSTCPIFFDNVRVPKANLLGEPGRGHIIAFNILNIGRLKLGPFAVGGAKQVLETCLKYAGERIAFGKPISEFGLIQQKLAEMAIRLYAAESLTYRTVGHIEAHLSEFSWADPSASQQFLKAVEEFAIECSFVKVFASEMLDYVVDEGVQIHGGYGYHQDYQVERAYRDSRINRIFEGTNEINRLLALGMLLKRAQRGQLPLIEAVKRLQSELLGGASPVATGIPEEARLVTNAKKIGLFLLGAAYQRFLGELEHQQEVLAGICDVLMQTYAMESAYLRSKKLGGGSLASTIAPVFLRTSMEQIEPAARTVLAACSQGDVLRTNLAVLKKFTKFEPINMIEMRRAIARKLLCAGHYAV